MTIKDYSGAKKVLVTGATGFIGRHLCDHLLASGFLVRTVVKEESSNVFKPCINLEQYIGDLLDKESLFKACENVDFIVHLAGLAHASASTWEQLYQTNVFGTELLLAAAIKCKVNRLVFMSSSLAAEAASASAAATAYGRAKLAAEECIMSQHNKGNIEGVILRPVNVYGCGMQGNIASLISMVSRRLAPPLPQLKTLISLIGVEDVCEATRLAIISENACGKIYNLTDGVQYMISDIETAIYRQVGRKEPTWRTPRLLFYFSFTIIENIGNFLSLFGLRFAFLGRLGMRTYNNLVEDSLFAGDKIKEELDFSPETTFYRSLPKIVENLNS